MDDCGLRCNPTSADVNPAERACASAQPPEESIDELTELYELALETLRAHVYGTPMPEKYRDCAQPAAPAQSNTGPNNPEMPTGVLQPIAAKVLMKVLYGARMARFDLLRAVC